MSEPTGNDPNDEHAHGSTSYSFGACELCWSEAFIESRTLGGSQVDRYRRLLVKNEGRPGHVRNV